MLFGDTFSQRIGRNHRYHPFNRLTNNQRGSLSHKEQIAVAATGIFAASNAAGAIIQHAGSKFLNNAGKGKKRFRSAPAADTPGQITHYLRQIMPKDHRRIEPIEDATMAEEPPHEPPQLLTANASTQKDENGLGRQTLVTPLPRHIKPGLPEYFTTKIVASLKIIATIPESSNPQARIAIGHLNGNVLVSSADFTNSRVTGQYSNHFNYFAQIYDWYSVQQNELDLTIINPYYKQLYDTSGNANGLQSQTQTPMIITEHDVGKDRPTFSDSLELLLKDPKTSIHMLPAPDLNNPGVLTISRIKSHTDYVNAITEIKTDAMDNVWTLTNTDPGIDYGTFYTFKNFQYHPTKEIIILVRCIQTIQFKEAKTNFKFGNYKLHVE